MGSDDDKKKVLCVRALVREAVVVVALFALLTAVSEGKNVSLRRVGAFLVLYVGIAYFLQAAEIEFADQFTRVVGFQLGSKMFTTLTG